MPNKWIIRLAIYVVMFSINILASPSMAQTSNLSATLSIIAEGATLQRTETERGLPLSMGAVAPLGDGDIIETDATGRVFITFADVGRLLLLPNSRLQLHKFSGEGGQYDIAGTLLEGIAIQDFTINDDDLTYSLATDEFEIVNPGRLSAVWAVSSRPQTVVNMENITLINDEDAIVVLEARQGVIPDLMTEPITYPNSGNAAQIFGAEFGCRGTVQTEEQEGLLVRQGPGQGYQALNLLPEQISTAVVGVSENGFWNRVQFDSSYGWVLSIAVSNQCEDLPVFPDDTIEENEVVINVTDAELELLIPFYGEIVENPVFYQFQTVEDE